MTETARRRVTAADVAREAAVSPATVGFVLNRTKGQTISEETRRRVLAAAERLNYKPHQAARALRRGRSKIVLLVLPEWRPEDNTLLDEFTQALDADGYALVTYTPQPHSSATPLWSTLDPSVVIGFEPFSAEDVADMRSTGIRNIIPSPEMSTVAGDLPDFDSGPRLQVEHLIRLGHTRLGFAYPPDPRLASLVEQRRELVRQVCAEAGIPGPIVRSVGFEDPRTATTVGEWLGAGVTAVVGYNDATAADVISAAVRSGVDVPGTLSVVGHDNSALSSRFLPSISSISIDLARLGRFMAALALHLAEGRPAPAAPQGTATLVERESIAPRIP